MSQDVKRIYTIILSKWHRSVRGKAIDKGAYVTVRLKWRNRPGNFISAMLYHNNPKAMKRTKWIKLPKGVL